MPADVIMPALGMAQDTGKVVRWLRNEGEEVVKAAKQAKKIVEKHGAEFFRMSRWPAR